MSPRSTIVSDPASHAASTVSERDRLARLYEGYRERLLDLTNRNPLLNSRVSPGRRSRRMVQIVNVALEGVYQALRSDDASPLDIVPLPDVPHVPPDEMTEAFISAFEHARLTEPDYLAAMALLDADSDSSDLALHEADEALRHKVRSELGLPDRTKAKAPDPEEHARQLGINPGADLELRDAASPEGPILLRSLLYANELEEILDRIIDHTRLSLQETAVSTLYLAFGFLERPDPGADGKILRAPLLLVPVRLAVRKVGGRDAFGVTALGAAESNLSLLKLVERDFRRALPRFEPILHESQTQDGAQFDAMDAFGTIGGYFDGVSRSIEGMKGWRIRPWLALGSFAFGRHQIYHDLQADHWPEWPSDHPLVRTILAGAERPGNPSDFAAAPDFDVDRPEIERLVPHLIVDVDSSQHQALVDVARGQNMVIEGPPGTGKSQTIANMIAHAIGEGKRVLFLAEKQAALEVVRRKLMDAGLEPFCLQLHSESAVPKSVIEALKARAELGWGRAKDAVRPPDAALLEARQSITGYLRALHEPLPDGETPFRLFWRSLQASHGQEAACDALRQSLPASDDGPDLEQLGAQLGVIDLYALAAGEFEARHGSLAASPWSRVGLNEIAPYDFQKLRSMLTVWRQSMIEALALIRETADYGFSTLAGLRQLVEIDARLGWPRGGDYIGKFATVSLEIAASALAIRAEISTLEARMARTPDLVLSPRIATARAAELVASRFGDAVADRVPADLSRAIKVRVAEAQELLAAVSGLTAALDVMGVDRSRPAPVFHDVARLCRALASMPASRRATLYQYRDVDPQHLAGAQRRMKDLSDAVSDWRRHFPKIDLINLPPVQSLRRLADWMRQGAVARLAGAFNGEIRENKALLASLTDNSGGFAPNPALIEQFAVFVAFCDAFANDPVLKTQFGTHWQGLATPFSDIETSIALRRAFRQAVIALSASPDDAGAILDSVLGLSVDESKVLAGLSANAERFLAVPSAVHARLKDATLGSAIPAIEAEIRAAATLEDFTGDAVLMSLERPLSVIADYHTCREQLNQLNETLLEHADWPLIGHLLDGGDPLEALAAVDWLQELRASGLPEAAIAALSGGDAFDVRNRLGHIVRRAAGVLERLAQHSALAEHDFGSFHLNEGDPSELLAQIDGLIAHHGQIGDYLVLRRLKLDLAAEGLGAFLDVAERLQVSPAELPQLLVTVIARSRADQASRVPQLAQASGIEMDVRRKIFADRDRKRFAVAREDIRASLISRPELKPVPGNNFGPKATWTELSLLNNEFAKSGRHLPIRSLFMRAGRSIQAMTPCVMASPISLAKFVPTGVTFDLLVIDEASQMRPEDALGGLLRARQVVVVGDSRQLPPTDFFRRAEVADNPALVDEDELDAESILDVCARSFSTVRRLKWHYRSRCESLIAFSNREFYRDNLITFPNCRLESFSIDLVRVNGTYRNRRNPDEAVRVAEEAIRFMREFALSEHPPSLGIATLNIEQRDLIREEVRRIATGDELVAQYLERLEQAGEPFFVKNIEMIQGDERDYVMISLVRGPAPDTGTIAQNFGPLAGRHGARRLNVLITRARLGIGLFASLGSTDIRTSETSPVGVQVLKRFLHYVEDRGRTPAASTSEEPDSDFEREVADRLTAAGFKVALQVGVSGYRIDLAVYHPDRPSTFLAGIECDGATYHSSKSARDRDRLREEVLHGLGWELIRVWSTDWFANPDEETRRLVRRLDLLRVLPTRTGMGYRFGQTAPWEDDQRYLAHVATGQEGVTASTEQLELDLDSLPPMTVPPDEAVRILDDPAHEISQNEGNFPVRVTPEEEVGGFQEAETPYQVDMGWPVHAVEHEEIWDIDKLKAALAMFREAEIYPARPGADRQRSILRPSMIETLVNERVVEPSEWAEKVPAYLRLATDPAELRFLGSICKVIARLG